MFNFFRHEEVLVYLMLPALSPDARCLPSGLTRIDLTPLRPSYELSVFSVVPALDNSKSFKNVSSWSTYNTFNSSCGRNYNLMHYSLNIDNKR